ncbi:MAG: hypothetical protein ACOY4K_14830 [Pseudomonadota bacterium]
MDFRSRPLPVLAFTALLGLAALFMAYLGSMAAGYFAPALVLAALAGLLWTGRFRKIFEGVMIANQASGALLILVLWLGGGLGDLKLDIAGVALLVNLAAGGPLLALISMPLLPLMRLKPDLPAWFGRADAAPATAVAD